MMVPEEGQTSGVLFQPCGKLGVFLNGLKLKPGAAYRMNIQLTIRDYAHWIVELFIIYSVAM